MKPSTLLRMTLGLAGLTAALSLAPASRAQADVAPDHFDGTDPWAAALSVPAAKAKSNASVQTTKPAPVRVEPVAARTGVPSRRAADRKRKSTPASN
jgi:hypothetical protein